ncbi:SDR family NAD(P)-dependent oxidoreductase [Haloarchaeobius sp. DFWS5]|uniref:SDR family NAD(P)-dependent oxidoreductase n=1 Tax=Haloarchaeobius sp. DFWS5 TaxID=3446114 RepID=UPI003EB6BCC8
METARERTVVVTGSNRGIGHHVASTLVDNGYLVACLDIEGDNVELLHDETPDRVRYYECDVRDDEAVESAIADIVDHWGSIDILVNNAAVATVASFDAKPVDELQRESDVNFFGYLRTIRAVLPHMRTNGGGIIHNVSSPTGRLGHPGLSGYAATKGAVDAFTRSLRLELRDENISCSVMYPPTTETRMTADFAYPAWMVTDAATVGRKLARKVESTAAVVTPDLQTRIGIWFLGRFPSLWARLSGASVDLQSDTSEESVGGDTPPPQ